MLYILYLSFLAAMFMYDAGNDSRIGKPISPDQMLPTPVSVSNNDIKQFSDPYDVSVTVSILNI